MIAGFRWVCVERCTGGTMSWWNDCARFQISRNFLQADELVLDLQETERYLTFHDQLRLPRVCGGYQPDCAYYSNLPIRSTVA